MNSFNNIAKFYNDTKGFKDSVILHFLIYGMIHFLHISKLYSAVILKSNIVQYFPNSGYNSGYNSTKRHDSKK